MKTFDWVGFVMFLIVIFGVSVLVAGSIQQGQTRAVCESYGWDSGTYYFGEEFCTQEITCPVDDVIAGACNPAEVVKHE